MYFSSWVCSLCLRKWGLVHYTLTTFPLSLIRKKALNSMIHDLPFLDYSCNIGEHYSQKMSFACIHLFKMHLFGGYSMQGTLWKVICMVKKQADLLLVKFVSWWKEAVSKMRFDGCESANSIRSLENSISD